MRLNMAQPALFDTFTMSRANKRARSPSATYADTGRPHKRLMAMAEDWSNPPSREPSEESYIQYTEFGGLSLLDSPMSDVLVETSMPVSITPPDEQPSQSASQFMDYIDYIHPSINSPLPLVHPTSADSPSDDEPFPSTRPETTAGTHAQSTTQPPPDTIMQSLPPPSGPTAKRQLPVLHMGPRADCEKCRLGVKGHWMHFN